jgi:hypothetical protein
MRSVPGELTTTEGGGPEMPAPEAMWNGVGALVAATTDAPSGLTGDGATAASGVTAESRMGETVPGEAATAPAKTIGVMAAMPMTGERITRAAQLRTASSAGPPPMCTRPS